MVSSRIVWEDNQGTMLWLETSGEIVNKLGTANLDSVPIKEFMRAAWIGLGCEDKMWETVWRAVTDIYCRNCYDNKVTERWK